MKYIQNGEECRIDGDINPFLVHEIKIYDDARYFIPGKLRGSGFQNQTTTAKEIKCSANGIKCSEVKNVNKHEQIKVIPHLGSDTEDEDEEEIVCYRPKKPLADTAKEKSDDVAKQLEEAHISLIRVSESLVCEEAMKIVILPSAHVKTLTAPRSENVEELVTFYVPPGRGRGKRGTLFYKTGERDMRPIEDRSLVQINEMGAMSVNTYVLSAMYVKIRKTLKP